MSLSNLLCHPLESSLTTSEDYMKYETKTHYRHAFANQNLPFSSVMKVVCLSLFSTREGSLIVKASHVFKPVMFGHLSRILPMHKCMNGRALYLSAL